MTRTGLQVQSKINTYIRTAIKLRRGNSNNIALLIFSRLEPLPQRIDASKKKSLCQSRSVLMNPSHDESAALRMTCECLNPTGSNKKTRISRKENEDILTKLEVSSNLFLWFKNTIEVCYKAEAAPLHFRIWKRKMRTLKNPTMRRKRKRRTTRKKPRRKNTTKRILKRFVKMSWITKSVIQK